MNSMLCFVGRFIWLIFNLVLAVILSPYILLRRWFDRMDQKCPLDRSCLYNSFASHFKGRDDYCGK